MDPSNSSGALSPSNSSRPYPTTTSPSDAYSHHRFQQHQQQHSSRPPTAEASVRSSAHHPMPSGTAPGSAEDSLPGSAPSRRHNYGAKNAYGNGGDTASAPGADVDGERRGHLRPPSSRYRSHDFAHVHQHQQQQQQQQQPPPYQHAYSDPTLPKSARLPAAYPSNRTSSPPPPARKPFPAYSSTRAPLPPGYASPLSPIDRFHPSPYAPTVSSGPSPAQSAPRSAGLHDLHSMHGVTQTPNWPTQASYTPNSVFSSYPNTPAGVGDSGGGGGGGPGSGGPAAGRAGYLSTTPVAHTPGHHEHHGQGADGNVADDEDFDGIPPGHVHVDAWGPQGPPAHVREMMRRRPMFEGGRVQPASPPKRYLGVERAAVDVVDRPQRQAELDGMRSPLDAARPPVVMSARSPAGLSVCAGNNSADTSDWTMSEHNEFDAESVTKGPSGTVRRAYTSTTHTVTHRHHHHHRPQDAQELLHVPPSVGGSSTAAIAATNDSMDVASPAGGGDRHHFPQHRLDADEDEDDWSESKTTVTHTTTKRRAPQHHHGYGHNQSLEHVRGQAIGSPLGSPNAVVEDTMPIDQGDEKHPFAQFTTTNPPRTSSSREQDMPAPPPYYDGAIPPPPPSLSYHATSASTSARRSGPAAPLGPAGAGSNSANVYFGNRRGSYFEDDRHPPPGMAASRTYWSDRERMMLMVDRDRDRADRADRDRYYRGYPPAASGYYPVSYPPPPPTLPPPRGGQFDVEVRHMAAEYPPRMPPVVPPASALPPLDEYERRAWAMGKRHDGLADGADERDRVRYDGGPPPMDARAPGYRSPMSLGRARYWGGSPHEAHASTSTRFHQHPAGYHRSYEEFMYEQREREYSAAMMDRGRGVSGGYDRMERGMMPPPPPPPAAPVGPSPPIMRVSRGGEPSEWAPPRALDAQSEGPPPYDVGSWQEQQRRGSPQRPSAGGRRVSHLSGGALGPVDAGHYGPRPDGWRHPSQFPPIDTQSMSASSQTAHASASASASPQRHDTDAYELPHNRQPNNAAPAVRRPHPPPQPLRVAQAPASSAAAPVSHPVTPVHSVPDTPLLQLGPNMGTTSVGLAIMAAIDEGDIGKRRDYLTFTRSTYTEMIECLRRPNDPLAPHITDRRRWKRLMNLLVEHPGQPTYQSLTWKQCPLWIVPHEDWDQLIWEYHYANGQPGLAECNTVAKTARMLGRLYQTRRSRCGIFIEYIAQLLAMCPHCAGGEEGAKIISKAKGKITIGPAQVQQSQTGESEDAGVGGQGSAASASASASGGAGTGSSQPTSEGADVAVPHSPRSPLDQQVQQTFALAPDGAQGHQAPRSSPRPQAHVYLPFSYLPGLPLDSAPLAPDQGQQPPASASALAARDPSNSPPSSGASQRMLVDGESDGELGSQLHDPLFSDPPPDPHVVFQDRR